MFAFSRDHRHTQSLKVNGSYFSVIIRAYLNLPRNTILSIFSFSYDNINIQSSKIVPSKFSQNLKSFDILYDYLVTKKSRLGLFEDIKNLKVKQLN